MEYSKQCMQKGVSSILDIIVVENGKSKETKVPVCAADEAKERRITA